MTDALVFSSCWSRRCVSVCLCVHRYVYQLRDLVRLYGTEEESSNSLPELERTEDWLYNEGSAADNPGAYLTSVF
eukprot:COSAG03_NODE_1958_length_3299_cov_2.608437_4_plen_75_part_00